MRIEVCGDELHFRGIVEEAEQLEVKGSRLRVRNVNFPLYDLVNINALPTSMKLPEKVVESFLLSIFGVNARSVLGYALDELVESGQV